MRIELKNFKYMASLSEETYCYTAIAWVNGTKAFEASNHGHGGEDMYHPVRGKDEYVTGRQLLAEATAYAESLPSTTSDLGDGFLFEMKSTLETVVHSLVARKLQERECKRQMRQNILWVTDESKAGEYWQLKKSSPTSDQIGSLTARYGGKITIAQVDFDSFLNKVMA
jgi:hypothetical protein